MMLNRLSLSILGLLLLSHIHGTVTQECLTSNLTLEHGSYIYPGDRDNSRPDALVVGVVVQACCDNGFLMEGQGEITCLESGEFSAEKPTCIDIDECTAPFLPTEGDDNYVSSSFGETAPTAAPHPLLLLDQTSCQGRGLLPSNEERCDTDNGACTNSVGSFSCTCRDGFVLDGVRCILDRTPCGNVSAPVNGRIIRQLDRRVVFGCQTGFTLVGCNEQICQRGHWVGRRSGLDCSPNCFHLSVTCEEPIAPRHGRLFGAHIRNVNSRVYIKCDDGYELEGSTSRVCLGNGRWSGKVPRCRPPRTLADIAADIRSGLIDRFAPDTNSSQERRNMGRSANIQSQGLDLVFAFDRSSSISESNFQLAINFTKELVRSFGVSYAQGGTRVAAITFASTADIAFSFTPDISSEEIVFERLDSLKEGIGGGTGLKEGLDQVSLLLPVQHPGTTAPPQPEDVEQVGNPLGLMRSWSKHVLFIFTDGRHNTKDPVILANSLKRNGMHIFAVGVGTQIDSGGLRDIASTPSASHFFHVRNFDDLEALTKLISKSDRDYSVCGQHGAAANLRTGNALAGMAYVAGEKVWPWLSIIHRDTPTGKEMMCSGALVCDQWVVTTASCFNINGHILSEGKLYELPYQPVTMTVTVGEYNRSREEGCEQTIAIDKVIQHPQYNPSVSQLEHDFDIAVVRLNESVHLNTCARTVCLPDEADIPTNCYVLGWGTAGGESAPRSTVPLQFPLSQVGRGECRTRARKPFSITDTMSCFRYSGLIQWDPKCNGDRGSPLVCQRDADNWFLSGVSTFGEGCSSYGSTNIGVYTEMRPDFVRWITGETVNCTARHLPEDIIDFNS